MYIYIYIYYLFVLVYYVIVRIPLNEEIMSTLFYDEVDERETLEYLRRGQRQPRRRRHRPGRLLRGSRLPKQRTNKLRKKKLKAHKKKKTTTRLEANTLRMNK